MGLDRRRRAGRGSVDEEKELNTSHVVVGSLALILVLTGYLAGWALNHQRPESSTEVNVPNANALSEQTIPRASEPVARIPSEDVPGSESSWLPRYPGSVRVEYERGQEAGLKVLRARYLTRDGSDAVRGYYRGVFRANGWKEASVEFSEDRWTFLVVHGDREANLGIESHGRAVTSVEVGLTEPLPKKKTPLKETLQKQKARPAPHEPVPAQSATPSPAPASPAPQSVSPDPVPDHYDDDGGDWDDLGDDEGGDD